ncbi:MAG: cytochrome c [Hyphomicrobiales bacterium]|nr:cytochrome c [Rhodoblastus sp.]MCO5088774.1 cytochrome c [Methylobacteriaceae bacterium]MDE2361149.1 cytochrome c [Hyphomicrobiales bacterium]HRY01632.1 cytochrome c [Beijerinckiaceae bacterium]
MNIKDNLPKYVVLAFFVGAIGLWFAQSNNPRAVAGIPVAVKLPQLSAQAEAGKKAFASNCAQCHGANGAGTDKGPPLIHDIYNPGHHADEAFFMAAKFGVRQHHWRFGDMPPLPQASQDDIAKIVRYIRELQVANGITYRQHRM